MPGRLQIRRWAAGPVATSELYPVCTRNGCPWSAPRASSTISARQALQAMQSNVRGGLAELLGAYNAGPVASTESDGSPFDVVQFRV